MPDFASAAKGVDLRAEARVARRGGQLSSWRSRSPIRTGPWSRMGSPLTGLGKNPPAQTRPRGGNDLGIA